jgi:hypothetical protein
LFNPRLILQPLLELPQISFRGPIAEDVGKLDPLPSARLEADLRDWNAEYDCQKAPYQS